MTFIVWRDNWFSAREVDIATNNTSALDNFRTIKPEQGNVASRTFISFLMKRVRVSFVPVLHRLNRHFPNLDALWARQVDVIINNTTDLDVFKARTPGAATGIVTLWESPLVPNDVLMTRTEMPAATQKMLADLFLNYGKTPQQKDLLRQAGGIAKFVPADNRLLAPVSAFKFATERAQAQSNTSLTDEQKATAVKRIDARAYRFNQAVQTSP